MRLHARPRLLVGLLIAAQILATAGLILIWPALGLPSWTVPKASHAGRARIIFEAELAAYAVLLLSWAGFGGGHPLRRLAIAVPSAVSLCAAPAFWHSTIRMGTIFTKPWEVGG
jgi:hypothetical protein